MPYLDLEFYPSDLVPGPVLVGQGDYNVDDPVIIEAPPNPPGEPDLIFERWTVTEVIGSLAGFSLDSPTSRIQDFIMPNVTQFRITANYIEDETTEPDVWPINFQRNVTNVDDLSDILEEIIDESFGVITLSQDEFTDYEINQFPQVPHLVENNQSFIEGEPVAVGVDFAQGYIHENWYQTAFWLTADDGFVNQYNDQSAFNFDMIADELWFQLNVRAVGPFTLTVSRNNSVAGSVSGGGEFDLISAEPFQAGVAQVKIDTLNYGYEFIEWAGDIEFIRDGYTVNDTEIEVNVMTNISLEAIFQETEEQEVFVNEQSVGPYTDAGIIEADTFTVTIKKHSVALSSNTTPAEVTFYINEGEDLPYNLDTELLVMLSDDNIPGNSYYHQHVETILNQVFTFRTATVNDQIVYQLYVSEYPLNDEFNILKSFFDLGTWSHPSPQPEIKLTFIKY